MNCNQNFDITLKGNFVYKALKSTEGISRDLVYAIVPTIYSDDLKSFNDSFINFYKAKHNKDPKFNATKATELKPIVEAAKEYFYSLTSSTNVAFQSRLNATSETKSMSNYVTANAREEGKRHLANIVLKVYNANQLANVDIEAGKETYKYYLNVMKQAWQHNMLELIAVLNGVLDVAALKDEYRNSDNRLNFLKDRLTGDNVPDAAKNAYALWLDLNGTDENSVNYVKSVFANQKLKSIQDAIRGIQDDTISDMLEESNTDDFNNEGGAQTDLDDLAGYDHTGQFNTYLKHVSAKVTNYLNSVKRLTNTGVEDTNNSFGLSDTLDAKECTTLIYNTWRWHNVDEMLNGFRDIAKTVPGFAAFETIANDLTNDIDFAYEMFTIFDKYKVTSTEIRVSGSSVTANIANNRSDAFSSLFYDLYNDIRGTAINLSETIINGLYDRYKAVDKVDKFTKADSKALADLKQEVVYITKLFFPSVQTNAVLSYIELYNNDTGEVKNQLHNIKNLISLLIGEKNGKSRVTLAHNIGAAKLAHATMQSKAKEAFAEIAQIRSRGWVSPEKIANARNIYNEDYAAVLAPAVLSITSMLLPYSVVQTQLNYRNIYGNNTSTIINNSMLSTLSKILDDYKSSRYGYTNDSLIKFITNKLKTNQYNYSNLFLEQKETIIDENEKEKTIVLNKGICKKLPNGNIELTDYGASLLRIMQYNGSSNMDNGSNIAYNKMLEGDYLPSSFLAFFNTNKDYRAVSAGIDKIAKANYFLRIPSDATNAYVLEAPRYSTGGVFDVADRQGHYAKLEEIAELKTQPITKEEFREKYRNPNARTSYTKITEKEFFNLIKGYRTVINNKDSIKVIDDERNTDSKYKAYVTVTLPKTDGDFKNHVIIFKGVIEDNGRSQYLTRPEIIHTLNVTADLKNSVDEVSTDLKGVIRKKYNDILRYHDVTITTEDGVEHTFTKGTLIADSKHPMFIMIKNQFKQELLDAATALSHYFQLVETEDSVPAKQKFRVKLSSDIDYKTPEEKLKALPLFKDVDNNRKGYNFYHINNKQGVVLRETTDENGLAHCYLDGKVFHSTKFTLDIKDENGDVINKNYLDELITTEIDNDDAGMINLLYGGGFKIIGTLNNDESVNVTDIELSDEQEQAINDKLSEFLLAYDDYVYNELREYKDFVPGKNKVNHENSTEFALNNLLMLYSFDELFDGNTKFYKDAQTVLKRAKQYQGSGTPYAIADHNVNTELSVENVKTKSFLNDGSIKEIKRDAKGKIVKDANGKTKLKDVKIQDLFKGTIFEGTTQRQGFYGVTIRNSVMTNDKALDELVEVLVKQGLSKNAALDLLYGPEEINDDGSKKRSGGFTRTKVNDAQSYITVQEWVRRVAASGQFKRYLPLIRKIINNEVLTANDLKEFIQVQKNFYYDNYYDERYGLHVPRQIKNAEFVLVPQLIKGTELEKVYTLMRKNGIDQLNTVETSKAANEELITLWNNDGVLDNKGIKEFKEKVNCCKMIYSYNYLYKQQDTPQHMNSSNKASVQIMKKMLDNLPENDPIKKEYFDLFTADIEESFYNIVNSLKIPINENGTIDLDENGHIKGIDNKIFFDRLREELARTGLNSNLEDYVTLAEDSTQPIMPCYLNNILNKFESTVQAMFNSNITRQKLPGFHAAQITNIGWTLANKTPYVDKENPKKKISVEKYESLSAKDKEKYTDSRVDYSPDLRYHPDGKGYIEVRVPYSFLGIDRNSEHYKNMTKQEILEELAKTGNKDGNHSLLDIIGYRIPTEGKQSVCNMKVVDFIDDAFGSTIVVPNDWVSQTGSDFDIDSVYAIQFGSYEDSFGEIHKIEYKNDRNIRDWYRYLKQNKVSLSEDETNELKEDSTIDTAVGDDELEELKEVRNLAYAGMDARIKTKIDDINARIAKKIKKDKLTGSKAYRYKLTTMLSELTKFVELLKTGVDRDPSIKKHIDDIQDYIDATRAIDDYIKTGIVKRSEEKQKAKEEFIKSKQKLLETKAKAKGLLSLDEYLKPENSAIANSKNQRDTRLLELMQQILLDPANLEENLSRSNFDDAVGGRNEIRDVNEAKARAARSPYNVIHQIKYQEEARSGAVLKGVSVDMDTLCSIGNVTRAKLGEGIRIVYDSSRYTNKGNKPSDIIKRFTNEDNSDVNKNNKTSFVIEHNTYGHSNDMRCIAGKILTSYSSQTTALILDNIKEGGIPNVNIFTFPTFKTLLNVGTDYYSAESFIMTPGISRIVKAYQSKMSIFSDNNDDPIDRAIRDIAKDLGVDLGYTNTDKVLETLNTIYGARFGQLFEISDKTSDGKDRKVFITDEATKNKELAIRVKDNKDRIDGKGKFDNSVEGVETDRLLFDLGCVLMFKKLYNTTAKISAIQQCIKSDKFGAKQTVYATREMFKKIDDCIYDKRYSAEGIVKKKRTPILYIEQNGEKKHLLEAIYPDATDPDFDKVQTSNSIDKLASRLLSKRGTENSIYPSLYGFLKYSTALSIVVAKQVMPTQQDRFVDLVEGINDLLSDGNTIDEETYNSVQSYILGACYNNVSSIKYPITFVKDGKINLIKGTLYPINDYNEGKTYSEAKVAEINEHNRVYGYKRGEMFEPSNVNFPTGEEMLKYETLTPAQKVAFIQSNFKNAGIFEFIRPILQTSARVGKNVDAQQLTFREGNINENTLFLLFRQAYENNNPYIASAAIDIVKYAVLVEGFNMSATAVNKLIDNQCLINDFGPNGLGFVNSIKDIISSLDNPDNFLINNIDTIYENYLVSHRRDIKSIETINYTSDNKAKYQIMDAGNHTLLIKPNIIDNTLDFDEFNDRLKSLGIMYYIPELKVYAYNSYVKVQQGNIVDVYKIKNMNNQVILTPLTPNRYFQKKENIEKMDNFAGAYEKTI